MDNQANNLSQGIALRKIPVSTSQQKINDLTNKDIDKIKIFELSNLIDKWEQEVLFADNGYYSLKGKEAEEKKKEYISELSRFINKKINEITFISEDLKEKAKEIKDEKIKAVQSQMEIYSKQQMDEWETTTYEESLSVCIQRAALYKKNPIIIERAKQNGLKVLDIISEKENWNNKLQKYKKTQFLSDFYISLINAFIQDKDIEAYQYYQKYKDEIDENEQGKIEKQVNNMRINIIANNWAKEVFSYKLDEKDYEKELNNIEDEEVKSAAKEYYSDLKKYEKRNKLQEEKERNIDNWKEVVAKSQQDINTAALYIDYNCSKESTKSKKEYIKQMRERGSIKTDINKFLTLFQEAFSDFQIFKDKDISDYRGYLSNEDYEMFENIQKYSINEFIESEFDYKYAIRKIKDFDIKDEEKKYDVIRMYFISKDEYKTAKKENADIEKRTKMLETILERYKN